jgi:hypothetical protein
MKCRCKILDVLSRGVEPIAVRERGAGKPFSKRKKNGKERFVFN